MFSLCLCVFLCIQSIDAKGEPKGIGKIGSVDNCLAIKKGPQIRPIRTNVQTVSLSNEPITLQSTSSDAICAFGIGAKDVNFAKHGSRSIQTGLSNSWMNPNPNQDQKKTTSLTKMLQVEVYDTRLNVINRYAADIADQQRGGTCTCPDGSIMNVAARLLLPRPSGEKCLELNCHGGISSKCTNYPNPQQQLKIKLRAGYCAPQPADLNNECKLMYCNAYLDLKKNICDGKVCSTADHVKSCYKHWTSHGKKEQRSHDPDACMSAKATTVETTELFAQLTSMTPSHIYEGGKVRITDEILGGETINEWIHFPKSTMELEETMILFEHYFATVHECKLYCQRSSDVCLGFLRIPDSKFGKNCVFFYKQSAVLIPNSKKKSEDACYNRFCRGKLGNNCKDNVAPEIRGRVIWQNFLKEERSDTKDPISCQEEYGVFVRQRKYGKKKEVPASITKWEPMPAKICYGKYWSQDFFKKKDLALNKCQDKCAASTNCKAITHASSSNACVLCTSDTIRFRNDSPSWTSYQQTTATENNKIDSFENKFFDILNPTYGSGQLFSNSIYSNNHLGQGYGRGRLSESEFGAAWVGHQNYRSSKNTPFWQIAPSKDRTAKEVIGIAMKGRQSFPNFVGVLFKISIMTSDGKWVHLITPQFKDINSVDSQKQYNFLFADSYIVDRCITIFFLQTCVPSGKKGATSYMAKYVRIEILKMKVANYYPSGRFALLVPKSNKVKPTKFKQFAVRFKGHIWIEKQGYTEFLVTTSHPFQLSVNHQGVLIKVNSRGQKVGSIYLPDSGYYSFEAQYFFYGEYNKDTMGSAQGNDTPLLSLQYKINGVWEYVNSDMLNSMAQQTMAPCPTHIESMISEMKTTAVTTSHANERQCSLRELKLPTIIQWAESYTIFVMAHDNSKNNWFLAMSFLLLNSITQVFNNFILLTFLPSLLPFYSFPLFSNSPVVFYNI